MSEETLRKKALELELAKQYTEAAGLYRKLRMVDKAAYMYGKAGDIQKAVQVLMEAGQTARAISYCRKGGFHRQAAKLFETLKDFANAASEWLGAGESLRAAALYERMGRDEQAAKIYQGAGKHLRAARLFEKAKCYADAASAYAEVPVEEIIKEIPHPYAQRAIADILEQDGHLEHAASLYTESHSLGEAVFALIQGEHLERAAALCRHATADVASEVIDQIPRDGQTYLKVVEVFMKAEDAPAAARVCEANGNLERAGECYEQGGLFQEAAQRYYKAKAYSKMGSAFEKAGDYTKAAEVFEGAHLYAEAARCQEKLQNWLRAGELYFKTRGYAQARTVLSKIPKSDLAYTKAHVLLQAIAKLEQGGAA